MNEVRQRMTAANKRKNIPFEQGRHQEALDVCLEITRIAPKSPYGWGDTAISALRPGRCLTDCTQKHKARSMRKRALRG
jgi:hypothetical protein